MSTTQPNTITEIKAPICPAYASEKTRARFIAWNRWDGFGRRPGFPAAALKKDKIASQPKASL